MILTQKGHIKQKAPFGASLISEKKVPPAGSQVLPEGHCRFASPGFFRRLRRNAIREGRLSPHLVAPT